MGLFQTIAPARKYVRRLHATGWTDADIAEEIGASRSQITRIHNGSATGARLEAALAELAAAPQRVQLPQRGEPRRASEPHTLDQAGSAPAPATTARPASSSKTPSEAVQAAQLGYEVAYAEGDEKHPIGWWTPDGSLVHELPPRTETLPARAASPPAKPPTRAPGIPATLSPPAHPAPPAGQVLQLEAVLAMPCPYHPQSVEAEQFRQAQAQARAQLGQLQAVEAAQAKATAERERGRWARVPYETLVNTLWDPTIPANNLQRTAARDELLRRYGEGNLLGQAAEPPRALPVPGSLGAPVPYPASPAARAELAFHANMQTMQLRRAQEQVARPSAQPVAQSYPRQEGQRIALEQTIWHAAYTAAYDAAMAQPGRQRGQGTQALLPSSPAGPVPVNRGLFNLAGRRE